MNFLFPSVLWGLGLIAISIIIHFFNFQRARRVAFTNVAFLKTVKEVTNSRNKLKNLLVLLARILFIACLVIAFARPFIPQNEVSNVPNGKHVSIYLDNSYSMQNEQDGRRLLDLAINYADQISQSFPKNTVFQLLDNRFEGSMGYFAEGDKISEKLGEIEFGNTGRSLDQVLIRQHDALENNAAGMGNHIFWISDFQQKNTSELSNIKLDSGQNYYLIPLTPNSEGNLLIDSIWLDAPFVKVQENQTFNIKVRNEGKQALENKVVKLFIDDKQVSSATISVSPNSSKILKLNFAVATGGQKMGRVSIEDLPLLFDNEYFFILNVAPKINIVSIAGDENNYVREVYSNEPFFNIQHYSINSLDYASLNSADLVVLSNLKEIDNSLQTAIRKAMNNGSSLVVFPSIATQSQSYTNLLGLNLRANAYKPGTALMSVASPDDKNPFFEGIFEKVESNMDMPKGFQSLNWSLAGQTLLKFKNGQPFLSAVPNGKSNLFVFASPLDVNYSDFPKHALFVPIMYKIALASKTETDQLAYNFSEDVATVGLEKTTKGDIFKLVKGNFEMIPSQRIVDGELLINIPKAEMEAGCYEIRHSQTNQLVGAVAFNYDTQESDLGFYNTQVLEETLGRNSFVKVFNQVEPETFAKTFKSENGNNQFWRYFIVLALAFLLIETLLIRFWKS